MPPRSSAMFESVLSDEAWMQWRDAVQRGLQVLDGRTVWNVNTTASGGGVAEMLWSLLAYARGVGIDTRWLVMDGNERFFRLTKRIHNMVHGAKGDGLGLDATDHKLYQEVSRTNAEELRARTRPGDVIVLHDPQTAGMVPLVQRDRFTVWRSHIGVDALNEVANEGWRFLAEYIAPAHRYVFTRRQYAPLELDPARIVVIPPSIDAFSPKNQQLAPDTVRAILNTAGLVSGWEGEMAVPGFVRTDGTIGIVSRPAALPGPPPPATAPLVVQVSRWDRLKDPVGVIRGFVEHTAPRVPESHVLYAGPAAAAVADDPEGAETMRETRAAWAALPEDVRARVHLADLPMEDQAENAAIVNALQRHAAVVVQKSLAEGFGLTVAEAMWKHRPVVASGVGGIQDQIENGVSGVLLDDPRDGAAYGNALTRLLTDPRSPRAWVIPPTSASARYSSTPGTWRSTRFSSRRCSDLGLTAPRDRPPVPRART